MKIFIARVLVALCVACGVLLRVQAQSWEAVVYPATNVVWQDLWVSAGSGSDASSGTLSNQALRTLTAAWARIPSGSSWTSGGYRVRILPGAYTNTTPAYWENRIGTVSAPVWFRAEGTNGSVILSDITVFNCSHLYFQGLHFRKMVSGGDGLQIERGRHILLRDCVIEGRNLVQEGLKVNQSQHIYVEGCTISGAGDNAVDFVAVQYGHIARSRIHDAGDWALYVKGGSAYIVIEANEVFNAGTGGITAGQGTGFEWMTSPWLHYEAYDIKIANNYIHDTEGAGLGVNGGYNILLAHNTLIRTGSRSHVLEVVHGGRSCDGYTAVCESNRLAGGWGTASVEGQYIPNRNVYVFNNLIYNPAPYQSLWQHFTLFEQTTPPPGSNVPDPARADDGLLIRGNVIWNGPPAHPVGGCMGTNGACRDERLIAENYINLFEPDCVSPATGDFRPRIGGNLFAPLCYPIPSFPGGDRPARPVTPDGVDHNHVPRDYTGASRTSPVAVPGAYSGGASVRLSSAAAGRLFLQGESGYRYRIERGGDLRVWNAVTTVTATADELILPPVSPAGPHFYRAQLVP